MVLISSHSKIVLWGALLFVHFGVRETGLSRPYAAEPTRPLQARWIPVSEGKPTPCYEPSPNACLFICLILCQVFRSTVCCYVRLLYCCLSVVVRTLDKPCIVAYIMSHFMLLHSLILLICATLPVLRQWPVLPPQSREWGELLQLCVSRLRGFVWFFPLRRGEE